MRTQATSSSIEGNLKRNIPEKDVDAPLQCGVVRVFKQPGIECPSGEDDFIEVRSERQMLNDRCEQREKEITAKSRVTKQPRKLRYSFQGSVVSTGSNKISASYVVEASSNICSEGRRMVNKEPTMVSQLSAPIGTPVVDTDAHTGYPKRINRSFIKSDTT